MRKQQLQTFLQNSDFANAELFPLAGDASNRCYIRAVLSDKKAMIMDSPLEGENFYAFIKIADFLYKQGYSAPRILARDIENGFLLLEDLGDDSFSRVLQQATQIEAELYKSAIDVLVSWRTLVMPDANFPCELVSSFGKFSDVASSAKESLDTSLRWYDKSYNHELYLREITLFIDWFLPQAIGEEKAKDGRAEYIAIWQEILNNTPLKTDILVHRDYHADNLLWLPNRQGIKRVGLLDFQDAVLGDPAYDIVSLLEDARRDVSSELAQKMITYYVHKTDVDEGEFLTAYNVLAAQRNSKIMGIFARLAMRDGKTQYLNYQPRVWKYLQQDVKHPALAKLASWLDKNVKNIY